MDFSISKRAEDLRERAREFVKREVMPLEPRLSVQGSKHWIYCEVNAIEWAVGKDMFQFVQRAFFIADPHLQYRPIITEPLPQYLSGRIVQPGARQAFNSTLAVGAHPPPLHVQAGIG